MTLFIPGLVHMPVTPFTRENRIDFEIYGKLIEFHLQNGAEALAVAMHPGESVSLGDSEQRELIDFAIRQVKGRVPVLAHTSDSGTSIAEDRARYAQDVGAAAVIATTPYYWTPPQPMIIEHFTRIAAAVSIPFYLYYSPQEMAGVKLSTESVIKLVERRENFVGVLDASLDWQFMINILSNAQRIRPGFQLAAGSEYMVSAGAIGATSMFSSLAGIAPKLIRRLYDICRREAYFEARRLQEETAELFQAIKKAGIAGLKGAMRAMGRDCGEPRPPLEATDSSYAEIKSALDILPALKEESRGW